MRVALPLPEAAFTAEEPRQRFAAAVAEAAHVPPAAVRILNVSRGAGCAPEVASEGRGCVAHAVWSAVAPGAPSTLLLSMSRPFPPPLRLMSQPGFFKDMCPPGSG